METFKENATSLSYDSKSIVKRALYRFYEAYTQMYLPVTIVITLRECMIKTFTEYMHLVQLTENHEHVKFYAQQEEFELIKKHIIVCCRGKGYDTEQKFIQEITDIFNIIKFTDANNKQLSDPQGVQ